MHDDSRGPLVSRHQAGLQLLQAALAPFTMAARFPHALAGAGASPTTRFPGTTGPGAGPRPWRPLRVAAAVGPLPPPPPILLSPARLNNPPAAASLLCLVSSPLPPSPTRRGRRGSMLLIISALRAVWPHGGGCFHQAFAVGSPAVARLREAGLFSPPYKAAAAAGPRALLPPPSPVSAEPDAAASSR